MIARRRVRLLSQIILQACRKHSIRWTKSPLCLVLVKLRTNSASRMWALLRVTFQSCKNLLTGSPLGNLMASTSSLLWTINYSTHNMLKSVSSRSATWSRMSSISSFRSWTDSTNSNMPRGLLLASIPWFTNLIHTLTGTFPSGKRMAWTSAVYSTRFQVWSRCAVILFSPKLTPLVYLKTCLCPRRQLL